jgi:hypothetical protein
MKAKREFTAAEDALILRFRAGEMHARALVAALGTSPNIVYRRLRELCVDPYRKPDRRTRPAVRRDFLKLRRVPV